MNADNNDTDIFENVAAHTIYDDKNMIGWKNINNQWYYLDSASNYVKGWQKIDALGIATKIFKMVGKV